ncbi:mucin-2 [Aedes aegypti]|uniref:Uncharacterized protein n=1 Tax=Aedes aegypti TaxID=7159 RepID=A0A6I8TTW8_AEDAE|nr:mucin-2 [Aedes aegypti]
MKLEIVTWMVFFELSLIIVGHPLLDEKLRKHFYGVSSEEKVIEDMVEEEEDARPKRLVEDVTLINGLDPELLKRFYADEKKCGCKEVTTEVVISTTTAKKKKRKTECVTTTTEIPTTIYCLPRTTTTIKPTTTRRSTTGKPITTTCRPVTTTTRKPTTTSSTSSPSTTTTRKPTTTTIITTTTITTVVPPTTTSTHYHTPSTTTSTAKPTIKPCKTTSTTMAPSTTTSITPTTSSSTASQTTTATTTSTHKPITHRPKGPHYHPLFHPSKPGHPLLPANHPLLPHFPEHLNHHNVTEASGELPVHPPLIPRRHRLPQIYLRPDCSDVETCTQHREAIRRILRRLNRLGPSDRRSDSELDQGPLKLDTVGLRIPRHRTVGVAPVVMSYDRTRDVREDSNPGACRRPEEHRDYVRYLRRTLREVKRNLRMQWNELPQCTDHR